MRHRPAIGQVLRGAVSVGLAVVLLGVVLPAVTGTRWGELAAVGRRLSSADLAVLFAIWLGSLWCYSWVITGSLPGVTRAQALTLNVCGSAVSNLVPFGGAVGLAVNFAMARSWGVQPAAFALAAAVSGIWNVLTKLALPTVALAALAASGSLPQARFTIAAAVAAGALLVVLTVAAGVIGSDRVATAVTRLLRRPQWRQAAIGLRRRSADLVRTRWHLMTAGMLGFVGGQALLQWVVLHQLGTTLSPVEVFAGYAFGRVLSAFVLTPGGVGVAETGAAALLVALGGDPGVSTTGVLLFTAFTFALEIPAGGVGYLVWLSRRSWRHSAVTE